MLLPAGSHHESCLQLAPGSATLAAAAGATTKELMDRMAHTSPAVALRYQHVMEDRTGAGDGNRTRVTSLEGASAPHHPA